MKLKVVPADPITRGRALKRAKLTFLTTKDDIVGSCYLDSMPACCAVVLVSSLYSIDDPYIKYKVDKHKEQITNLLFNYLRDTLGYTFAIMADNMAKTHSLKINDINIKDNGVSLVGPRLNVKSGQKVTAGIIDLTKYEKSKPKISTFLPL